MSNPVYLGNLESVRAAVAGGVFVLTGAEARHAGIVKRAEAGELVDIVDGHGRRITGTVTAGAPSTVTVDVRCVQNEPRPPVRLVLVQALAKGDRDERAIEAATELGVDAVLPWQADRSIVRWRADREAKGRLKWESAVREAAKQSRRSWVPEVLELQDTKGLARWLEGTDRALVLHEEASAGMGETLAGEHLAGREGTLAVVVGPEGGISPQERGLLEAAGAVSVHLGPHVLRSSTAGPAALAVLNQLLHRW